MYESVATIHRYKHIEERKITTTKNNKLIEPRERTAGLNLYESLK